jgi:hypothetical protein
MPIRYDDRVAQTNSPSTGAAESQPQYAGMGTTLVVALFHDNKVTVAHIGDSRLYRLRGGSLRSVTRDHSLLQEQIDSGMITAEEARHSQNKNLVTRALGVDPEVETEIHDLRCPARRHLPVVFGRPQRHGRGRRNRADAAGASANLELAATQLIQMANDNGGRDNVSVILVKVLREFSAAKGWWRDCLPGSSKGLENGKTDTQHGWSGPQGNSAHQGAHHHRAQAAQRHPDRQPGDQRRACGGGHHPQRFVSRGPEQHQRHAGQWQPIKKHFLQNNDVVELGKYKLKYINRSAGQASDRADFEKTMVLRPDMPTPAAPAAPAAPAGTGCRPASAPVPKSFGDTSRGWRPRSRPSQPAAAAAPAAQLAAAIQILNGANAGGTGVDQDVDNAGQAGCAGGGHRQASAWLLHHPCRRCTIPRYQWQAA